jgi:hypothetical protein
VCCNGKTVLLMIEAACVLHRCIYSREILQLIRFLVLSMKFLLAEGFHGSVKNVTGLNCKIIAFAQPVDLFHIIGGMQQNNDRYLKRSDKL